MLKTKRSKVAASGSFFVAALMAVMGASARPSQAQDGGDCTDQGGGPYCGLAEIVYYCSDGQGGHYECGRETRALYYVNTQA